MTGLVFNGKCVYGDKDWRECQCIAEESYGGNPGAFEECLNYRYETALENAHDEWWDASAPERWEDYMPFELLKAA